jgi:hypothetical protein
MQNKRLARAPRIRFFLLAGFLRAELAVRALLDLGMRDFSAVFAKRPELYKLVGEADWCAETTGKAP